MQNFKQYFLMPLVPHLHNEASSTSWLDELARRAHDELARRAHDELAYKRRSKHDANFQLVVRSSSHLVELASSCKRGISARRDLPSFKTTSLHHDAINIHYRSKVLVQPD